VSNTDRLPGLDWRRYWVDPDNPCTDCGVRTTPRSSPSRPIDGTWEWYMVHDHVWQAAHAPSRGYLCIGCLERRIERALTPGDFPPYRVNTPCPLDTPRLAARKEGSA
jgi:hypothetical protein